MNSQTPSSRQGFLGGSDARVIMGSDHRALVELWEEKRGDRPLKDLSNDLIVQLGVATEDLNRRWYEQTTGNQIEKVQQRLFHSSISFMAATLDGLVKASGAVFEAKFMLPWSFSIEQAAMKHMAQLQHNMLVANTTASVLSIITGGGNWLEVSVGADPLYQTVLIAAERRFWHSVRTGEPPHLLDEELPRPRVEPVRRVDMTTSNAWAEYSAIFRQTRQSYQAHEHAKTALKALLPQDAKEAFGHGVRAKRSKIGAVSFDLLESADAVQ